MTNKEKLQLLLEGKCKWCKKPSNLGSEYRSLRYYNNESFDGLYFLRNSCSTYFYNNSTMGTYSRFDNDDEAGILKFLDDVVWMSKEKEGPAVWHQPIVEYLGNIYYSIDNRYYCETLIHDAIKTCCLNKELELGKITINNKQYTIAELEKLIELAEQIKSWK
jgi:hypothetical protein